MPICPPQTSSPDCSSDIPFSTLSANFETLKRLTMGQVRASARHVLHMPGIHNVNFQSETLQNPHHGNPVNPGGRDGNDADARCCKQLASSLRSCVKVAKMRTGLRVPIGGHRYINLCGADIHSCGNRGSIPAMRPGARGGAIKAPLTHGGSLQAAATCPVSRRIHEGQG